MKLWSTVRPRGIRGSRPELLKPSATTCSKASLNLHVRNIWEGRKPWGGPATKKVHHLLRCRTLSSYHKTLQHLEVMAVHARMATIFGSNWTKSRSGSSEEAIASLQSHCCISRGVNSTAPCCQCSLLTPQLGWKTPTTEMKKGSPLSKKRSFLWIMTRVQGGWPPGRRENATRNIQDHALNLFSFKSGEPAIWRACSVVWTIVWDHQEESQPPQEACRGCGSFCLKELFKQWFCLQSAQAESKFWKANSSKTTKVSRHNSNCRFQNPVFLTRTSANLRLRPLAFQPWSSGPGQSSNRSPHAASIISSCQEAMFPGWRRLQLLAGPQRLINSTAGFSTDHWPKPKPSRQLRAFPRFAKRNFKKCRFPDVSSIDVKFHSAFFHSFTSQFAGCGRKMDKLDGEGPPHIGQHRCLKVQETPEKGSEKWLPVRDVLYYLWYGYAAPSESKVGGLWDTIRTSSLTGLSWVLVILQGRSTTIHVSKKKNTWFQDVWRLSTSVNCHCIIIYLPLALAQNLEQFCPQKADKVQINYSLATWNFTSKLHRLWQPTSCGLRWS